MQLPTLQVLQCQKFNWVMPLSEQRSITRTWDVYANITLLLKIAIAVLPHAL